MLYCELRIINTSASSITVEATGHYGTAIMSLSITQAQFEEGIKKLYYGIKVQEVFPALNSIQCEFIISGMSEAEQKRLN